MGTAEMIGTEKYMNRKKKKKVGLHLMAIYFDVKHGIESNPL